MHLLKLFSDAAEFRNWINNCQYGKKALLVTVPEFPEVKELYEKVKKSLRENGVEVVHFDGVIPNPTTDVVTEGANMAKAAGLM